MVMVLTILVLIAPLHGTNSHLVSDHITEMKEHFPEGDLNEEQFIKLSNFLVALLQKNSFDLSEQDPTSIDMIANAGVLIINCPLFSDPDSPKQREQGIMAIKMLLEEVNNSIDASWDFPLPRANISPPFGVPSAAAGMNPAEIKDSLLRKEYEDAIANNNAINLKNKQQRRLRVQQETIIRSLSSLSGKSGWKKNELMKRFAQSDQEIYLFNKFLK